MADGQWQVVAVDQVIEQLGDNDVAYKEFLRVPSLSCGVYRLAAGSKDMQGPHDDDEVYFVLSGKARMRVGDDEQAVGPGCVLYVQATADHSFFEIEEDMTLLVMFARDARSS